MTTGLLLTIVAFALLSILSLVAFFISTKKSAALAKFSNKKAILYYLAFGILLSSGGLIGMSPIASRSMLYFILLQLVYAGLGFLAAWVFRKYAPEEAGRNRNEVLFFVMANALLGMLGFTLVFHYFDPSGIAGWFSFCVVPFVLPAFLSVCFALYQSIPQDIHKVWYFPLEADEVDYDHIDTSVIYMLELEYSKSINDPRLTNTKLRAPVSMKFGDWFRSFIESYNYKHEDDPIQYSYDGEDPHGWIFYVKPGLFGSARFIDPDQTIADNKISEKNVIQAKRVAYVEQH